MHRGHEKRSILKFEWLGKSLFHKKGGGAVKSWQEGHEKKKKVAKSDA